MHKTKWVTETIVLRSLLLVRSLGPGPGSCKSDFKRWRRQLITGLLVRSLRYISTVWKHFLLLFRSFVKLFEGNHFGTM